MISASVGYHCPSCVTSASQGAGRIINVASQKPTVTYALIGINVFVFLVGLLLHVTTDIQNKFAMWPVAIAQGEWWRLLTSAFVHANIMHIGFNMLLLYQLGPSLEYVLGKSRYLSLYLLAALGGTVASYYFSSITTFSFGASGAIFGLMTATVVLGRSRGHDMSQIVGLIVVNVIIGFTVSGIDWRAHFGGATIGALVAAVFSREPNLRKKPEHYVALLGILALLVVMVFARSNHIQQLFGL